MGKIGYTIHKIVFRGYSAPASLQRMHDGAIEKRTSVALAKEAEEEQQAITDFKLTKEASRAVQQQEMAMKQLEHDIAVKQKTAEAEREIQRLETQMEIERLEGIRNLDQEGSIMVPYLIAKDCHLPPVMQCGTVMSAAGASSGDASNKAWAEIVQAKAR